MSRKRYKRKFAWAKIIISLVWASTYCESKMGKQDLQAGDS